ncbi:MAG: hypothetical protein L3J71_11880 [Victivallaceae bacterium]|nr:hypothetical protein [Victivallaceae bacterium]
MKKTTIIASLLTIIMLGTVIADETTSTNLIKNGSFEDVDSAGIPKKGTWFRSWYVHGGGDAGKQLKDKWSSKAVTITIEDKTPAGKRFALFYTPKAINADRADSKKGMPMISNGFGANIAVPVNDKATKYQLSFMLRGKTAKIPGLNRFVVVVNFKGSSDKVYKCKSTGKAIIKHLKMTDSWKQEKVSIAIPPKTSFVSLYLKLYGCGEAMIDDVKLQAAE